MSDNIIRMGGAIKPDLVQREQLAAQALAVIMAHWSRPSHEETLAILHCAERQSEAWERKA